MIQFKKADDILKKENGISDEAYICFDKNEISGIVEYKIDNENLILTKISAEDNLIADGLVRQTMNNALDNNCKFCTYDESIKAKLFELKIIKDVAQNDIDIVDFFMKLNRF
ncbi:MAG: hypothetical protein ACI39F_04715 [Acutalibacteraceae bacterium]